MVGPKVARPAGRSARITVRPLVVALFVSALVSCASPPTLADLGSLEDLKERFNNDAGQIRIILLLSPT